MELNIPKSALKVIGDLRVSGNIYDWICQLAKEYGVTNQEISRHILQKVYNEEESNSKDGMKLFVWEGDGVLQAHTNGLVIALAKDLTGALKIIEQRDPYAINNFPINKYKIYPIDKEEAFIVYGGD